MQNTGIFLPHEKCQNQHRKKRNKKNVGQVKPNILISEHIKHFYRKHHDQEN